MKPSVLVFGVSLIANVAMLLAVALQPDLAPIAVRDYFRTGSVSPRSPEPAPNSAQPATASPAKEVKGWAAMQTSDLKQLATRLRAAGYPPEVVRAIVSALIEQQLMPRYRELLSQQWPAEYWRPNRDVMYGLSAQLQALNRERTKLVRSALGDELLATDRDMSTEQQRRFGNLSQAKVDLVKQINEDYAEMTQQLHSSFQGMVLPEDREKLALLEKEKKADLAAVLTPEEMAEYELRNSPITLRLRAALTIMDASEAEFRAIYAAYQPFQDDLFPTSGGGSRAESERRREAGEKVFESVKAALGEQRGADFVRANDRDYQQMHRYARESGMPAQNVLEAYAVRNRLGEESMRIADDREMSAADKAAALRTLAQNARVQLNTLLGARADQYTSSVRWLRQVETGGAVRFDARGNPTFRTVARQPQTPRP